MSPLSRDSFPLNRRSPIDEDNDRERDIRQRPPRASGGPFPIDKERHLLWMVSKLQFEAELLVKDGHTQEGAHLAILASEAGDLLRSGGPFSFKDFADAVGVPEDDPRWDDARRRNQSNVLLPLVHVSHPDGVICDECAEARANPHAFQSHALTDPDGDPATCGFELPSGALCGGLVGDPEHVLDPGRCRHYGGTGKSCSDCVAIDLEDQEMGWTR